MSDFSDGEPSDGFLAVTFDSTPRSTSRLERRRSITTMIAPSQHWHHWLGICVSTATCSRTTRTQRCATVWTVTRIRAGATRVPLQTRAMIQTRDPWILAHAPTTNRGKTAMRVTSLDSGKCKEKLKGNSTSNGVRSECWNCGRPGTVR